MKKYKLTLILIAMLVLTAGCSKSSNTSAEKSPATNQTSSQTKASTSTTTSDVKATKDTVKDLSDEQLLKASEEPASDIEDLDLGDDDLAELDSIINNQDPTSDISTSVDLKK